MKTKRKLILMVIIVLSLTTQAQVAINTNGADADPSAMLDIKSENKGMLIPRLLAGQRNQIASPATGLMVYQTDGTVGFYFYNGTTWLCFNAGTKPIPDAIADTDGDTKVQVEENADEDYIRFDVTGVEVMTIANSGNVGIGTSTPNYSLDIAGDAVADVFRIRRGSDGSETVHKILDASGHIQYYNSSGNRGHDFITYDSSTIASRMRIIGNGNVGIGTTTPSQKLHVYHTEGNGQIINEMQSGASTCWSATGTTPYFGSTNDYGFSIITNNQYRITASNTGDVGIGTTSPSNKLSVVGDADFTGDVGIGTTTPSNKLSVTGDADFTGDVGIGTTSPDASALLDLNSTTKGFLPPRMSALEMNTIASPVAGLMVYNTSVYTAFLYDGSEWRKMYNNEGESCGTISYDGQNYQTVIIGTQCWMTENLNIGTMVNGSGNQTNNDTIEKYCYDDNTSNCDTYGGLYQWDEMMQYVSTEGTQGICPTGWHLPTDAEWKTMEMYLGMTQAQADATDWRGTDEGGKLKESGTTHWNTPNTGATNSSGFTGLPGGTRITNGSFINLTNNVHFWSSSEDGTTAWHRYLYYETGRVSRYSSSKPEGFSVRCLKD